MTTFLAHDKDGVIHFAIKKADGFLPFPSNGFIYREWTGPIKLTGDTPSSVHYWTDDGPVWVDMGSLDELRIIKSQSISEACSKHIFAGFMCSALGSPFLYPAKQQDQANLIGSVTDSLLAGDDPDWRTPFWCKDEYDVWEFRLHTVAQIQQVGREGKAAILAALSRNEVLQKQIAVANEAELVAIIWSME